MPTYSCDSVAEGDTVLFCFDFAITRNARETQRILYLVIFDQRQA